MPPSREADNADFARIDLPLRGVFVHLLDGLLRILERSIDLSFIVTSLGTRYLTMKAATP
jgi:hypothetical protein